MAFIKLLTVSELPPGTATEVMFEGAPVALCHAAGKIHALWGTCPHQGGPLGQGAIEGEYIACPWHAWEFNCATGRSNFNPGIRVRTYAVKIEGGDILVDCA